MKSNYNMNRSYTLKNISETLFVIIGPNGNVITNHLDEEFPPLSNNIAQTLCDDLNDINEANRGFLNANVKDEDKDLILFENEIMGNELRESFVYCVISTMMEANGNSFDLDIRTCVQWDRVFRLSPGPPDLQLEIAVLADVKKYFNEDWVNLQLNYSQSIDEMLHDGIDFVPDQIINKLYSIIAVMSPVERFIIDLLYNYIDKISITLPILWVAGKLDEDGLVDAYWVFQHGIHPNELDKEGNSRVRFLKNRLLYLKIIKWGYMWNDESLPR